ncbi:MAG: hypothetical protein ABSE51_20015 [Terracidiphilus sp.]
MIGPFENEKVTIRLDVNGMFITIPADPCRFYESQPVPIGRDEDGVPVEVEVFCDVDRDAPRQITALDSLE